jgi:hypothetical protein
VFFRLVHAQNIATQEISVQLLVRNEDEEFSDLPANLNNLGTIVEGKIDSNNVITEGVF